MFAASHEPNGEFWTGLAEYLVATQSPFLSKIVEYDPEAGTFIARGDHQALLTLARLMLPAVTNPDKVTKIMASAMADGYEFDD